MLVVKLKAREAFRIQGVGFRKPVMVLLCAFLTVLSPVALDSETEWEIARPDYKWNFPADHWVRDGFKTEWWYFTGHLEAETGEKFGYQFTFFRVGLLKAKPEVGSDWAAKDLIMGHAALSALSAPKRGNRHRFSEVLYRAVPLLGGFNEYPDSLIAWSRGPAGTDGNWELRWNGDAFDFRAEDDELAFAFDLKTQPRKPRVFQGPDGYSKKGDGISAASHYYSFTRLATDGTLIVDGRTMRVNGQSWMDKEFFTNSMDAGQVGWDWFSLQLDDQRELMLYILRDGEGRVDHARATLVLADGNTRYLEQSDFSITQEQSWESPSGDAYPSGWTIEVPVVDLVMRVRSQMEDQENRSRLIPELRYWEGAVKVTDLQGKRIGVGFVEMTGYGSARTPAL
jgi:predicted secreted hydrolase